MFTLAKSLYLYATSKEGKFPPYPLLPHPSLTSLEYSVLLLGLDNAGKTTLLNQIKKNFIPPSDSSTSNTTANANAGKTVPTIGQNVSTITLPDMYLKIWDVGGQLSMRGLWQSYYTSCHAIIFVVDSSDVGGDADISRLRTFSRRQSSFSVSKDEAAAMTSPTSATENSNPPKTPITPSFLNSSHTGRLDECARVLESVLQHADAAGVPLLVLANKQDREDCVEVVRIKEGLVRKVFEGEKGGGVRDSRVLPVSALKGTGVKEAVEWVRTRVKWNKEGRPPVMR
jgi:ADP-ribosylation factor related protein 1